MPNDLIYRPRALTASDPLLSAALGGLLTLAACNPNQYVPPVRPADAGGRRDAGETADSGTPDAGGSLDAGASDGDSAVSDASLPFDASEPELDASVAFDASAISDAGAGRDVGCDADRVRIITSRDAAVGMTLEAFTAMCEGLGGYIEIHPHCGGMNSCAGISYDSDIGILTEHTCAGLNTCTGYTCVIP